METEPRDQRVPIMLTVSELRTVDDWRRHQLDLPSRSEAIRRLIEAGLTDPIPIRGTKPAPGGSGAGGAKKPRSTGKSAAPRAQKAPKAQAASSRPVSKLEQIRALREQGAS